MSFASGVSYELKRALKQARVEWNLEPLTGEKYVYFDELAKDRYGIRLYQMVGAGYTGYDITDEEKFMMFLLKYSG